MNIERYIICTEKEITGEHKTWIDYLLTKLPTSSVLFEIGSATGRDADYMENSKVNLTVLRSDKEPGFVEYIKNMNKKASVFDILNDSFEKDILYDAFYAHMVINHFTLEQLQVVLLKLRTHLKTEGYVAFSFPLGDNTTLIQWNNTPGSIFCRYHSREEVEMILEKLHLQQEYLHQSEDSRTCYMIAKTIH